jgi:hypothetical protein
LLCQIPAIQRGPSAIKFTTGLATEQFDFLACALRDKFPDWDKIRGCKKCLSITQALRVCLLYYRTHLTQAQIGELLQISQPAVSNCIRLLEPALIQVTDQFVPSDVEEAIHGRAVIIDGTLFPCWTRKSRVGLYSGKHHRNGFNHQIISDVKGNVLWISDGLPGSVHDAKAFQVHGFSQYLHSENTIGDKGYQGTGIVTPLKKPRGCVLNQSEEKFNKSLSSIRNDVERAIAHIKKWKILGAPFRRPHSLYWRTIQTTRGLYFLTRHL